MAVPAGVDPSTSAVTLDEVKAHGNITGTASDDELLLFIATAQEMVEAEIGPVGSRTITETHVGLSGDVLWLDSSPVLSVTSVAEYGAVVDPSLYVLEPELGKLSRTTDYRWSAAGVTITYEAGRDQPPAAVRWAIMELTIHLWRSTQAQRGGRARGDLAEVGVAGFGLPNRVREALAAVPGRVVVA